MKKDDYYEGPRGCEKVTLIIIAIIVMILAACCTKPEYCWQCEQIKLHNISACGTIMKLDTINICYKTEQFIREFEKTYTYTICDESSIMKCKMK